VGGERRGARSAVVIRIIPMNAPKAPSENGRVVLEERTDIHDGMEFEVDGLRIGGTPPTVTISNDVGAVDDMEPEERTAFLRELEASCKEADAGHVIDAATALASLRGP